MPEDLKNQGLCSTCKNAPNCMYLKDKEQPVWYCNEFCLDDAPCKKIPLTTMAPTSSESKGAVTKGNGSASKYKGLCVDCNHRETCVLSSTPGGVWHCEEYE